ncbi:cytochrome c oxidase subunit I [Steroidobacter cummioxidans]|uniref:cytochrome c oxidase subunit I n=1 Tax=Steroidobacter cummioxidans TaxID=1803913 RepID=UPI000E30BF55|nr:cytochrome c oxidase subunit I [Steroidobacter cummioxidans]
MSAAPVNERMSPIALHKALERVWGSGRGWQRLSAVNHTVIGRRFIVTSLVFFAIGGVLAMLIRAQLATSRSAFVGPDIYNQLFTLHGTVMMFLFAIPLLEGLGMYLLPKMLGARDLAFPRLSAYGYWCYLFGGTIIVASMLFGVAPDGGWFMYTPLSSVAYTPGINADIWLLGITFVEISALTAAVEIVVSILKLRAPGMSLDRMPLFGWYMLITGLMMVVGFPPLILGSILLEMERAFGLPFFDPTRGGDALLWQHLFWLFGHPEVYIIFLPAAAVLSTIIPVFAQRPIVGYRAIVIALVALGFLSFGLWVHHMFTVGIPHLALAFFSAASMLVAIPTAVQIFSWLATLAQGRPRYDIPMLYVFGFFIVFVIGGLTGVMLAVVPFNWQVHDTHFVVAHLHYVLVGGFVFPMLAGAYYWLPHFTGRSSVHRLSVPAFWLILVGFNLTFFMMHLTGLLGMPRRVYTYAPNVGWEELNLLSSVGGFAMAMGFALVGADFIMQLRFGRRSVRNPWQASTLEWAQPTPPASYAFASLPHLEQRADRIDVPKLSPALAAGQGYLGFVRDDRMETLGVDMVTGRLEHVMLLPRRSYLPLVSGLLTAACVLGMLFKIYWLATLCALAVVASFVAWSQINAIARDLGPMEAGRGASVPPHTEIDGSAPWWAAIFALLANATLFASLVFGTLYLWLVAPQWPPTTIVQLGVWGYVAMIGFVAHFPLARRAIAANATGNPSTALLVLAVASLVQLAVLWIMLARIPDAQSHAHLATSFALLLYAAIHAGICLVLTLNTLLKARRGAISPQRRVDFSVLKLWFDYTAVTGVIAVALVMLMPRLIGMLPPS